MEPSIDRLFEAMPTWAIALFVVALFALVGGYMVYAVVSSNDHTQAGAERLQTFLDDRYGALLRQGFARSVDGDEHVFKGDHQGRAFTLIARQNPRTHSVHCRISTPLNAPFTLERGAEFASFDLKGDFSTKALREKAKIADGITRADTAAMSDAHLKAIGDTLQRMGGQLKLRRDGALMWGGGPDAKPLDGLGQLQAIAALADALERP